MTERQTSTLLLAPAHGNEYELLDAGGEQKLERFGSFFLVRPEPKAIWPKSLSLTEWNKADAVYTRSSSGGGSWHFRTNMPKEFRFHWNNLTFILKPTGFKHLGIFPEQAVFWQWMQEKITQASKPTHVLNLFGYTGAATVAALDAGAKVTHVDAEKEIITWANDNVKASGLENRPVRWMVDDVIKFVKREIKRGVKYDGIIMDPPKFGRGTDGQVWKIEKDLPHLIDLCKEILSPRPLFFILNAYTTEYSALTLQNVLASVMANYQGTVESGELVLPIKSNSYLLSTGIFSRWTSL